MKNVSFTFTLKPKELFGQPIDNSLQFKDVIGWWVSKAMSFYGRTSEVRAHS